MFKVIICCRRKKGKNKNCEKGEKCMNQYKKTLIKKDSEVFLFEH